MQQIIKTTILLLSISLAACGGDDTPSDGAGGTGGTGGGANAGSGGGAGAAGGASGGLREFIPPLLHAAAVAGADGFFLETHPDPARAPSDAETQWPLDELEGLLERTLDLWHTARRTSGALRVSQ
jgi:hypothetical protein